MKGVLYFKIWSSTRLVPPFKELISFSHVPVRKIGAVCKCEFMYHTHHIVSWRFSILPLGDIERQLVKVPLATAISLQPLHEMLDETRDRDRQPHRELCPLLFSTSVWVLLTSPANNVTLM